MDIKFDFIYDIQKPENSYEKTLSHKYFEIVYYKDGSGFTKINDLNYKYASGTYAIVPANIAHSNEHVYKTNLSVINFTVGNNTDKLPMGLFYDSNRSVLKCFEKIDKEFASHSALSEKFLDVFCAELYLTILRNLTDKYFNNDKIDYIVRYIEEFYCDDINVGQLADMSGYSCRHFRELFKSRIGLTPYEFILQTRLNMSKQLLVQTGNSIVGISQICGFASSSQFSLLFKRFIGMTPKQYRSENTKKYA